LATQRERAKGIGFYGFVSLVVLVLIVYHTLPIKNLQCSHHEKVKISKCPRSQLSKVT